jgi:pyrroline-5-carboxylate reductase
MLKDKKIVVIGMGEMGEILINSILINGLVSRENLVGSDKSKQKRDLIKEQYQINTFSSNPTAVTHKDIIILAIEPKVIRSVIEEIKDKLFPEQLIVSVVAGVSTKMIEEQIGKQISVVRAVPTPNAKIGESITILCQGRFANEEGKEIAKIIFNGLGLVETLRREDLMNSVSALSVIPAYTYTMIEALTDGGVLTGLPRDLTKKIVSQNILGACKMVFQTKKHPAELKDILTTPGGLTIEGLRIIEKGNIRSTFIESIISVERKCKHLIQ